MAAYTGTTTSAIQNGELSTAAGLAALSQQMKAEKEIGQNFAPLNVVTTNSQAVEQQTVSSL